jgi:hypothetical protein
MAKLECLSTIPNRKESWTVQVRLGYIVGDLSQRKELGYRNEIEHKAMATVVMLPENGCTVGWH